MDPTHHQCVGHLGCSEYFHFLKSCNAVKVVHVFLRRSLQLLWKRSLLKTRSTSRQKQHRLKQLTAGYALDIHEQQLWLRWMISKSENIKTGVLAEEKWLTGRLQVLQESASTPADTRRLYLCDTTWRCVSKRDISSWAFFSRRPINFVQCLLGLLLLVWMAGWRVEPHTKWRQVNKIAPRRGGHGDIVINAN